MDIERSLVSRVVREQEMALALDQNIPSDLFDGEARGVWLWVVDHWRRYGKAPSQDVLLAKFPEYGLCEASEPLPYYANKLREKFVYNTLSEAMKTAAKQLRDGATLVAKETVSKALLKIEDLGTEVPDYDWTARTEERLSDYASLKVHKGVDGVPTLFPTLDQLTGGFHAGEIIFVVARAGVGKTWFEVILALANWQAGRRPLLFTKEMADKQIARRLDARFSKLPYQSLRSGRLTPDQEARWQEDLAGLRAQSRAFWISGSDGGGVTNVAAKIERFKPDIVYIDGMYLMDDDRRADAEWQRLQNVARDLKALARRSGIPIVASLQFNNDGQIAGADLWRWPDLILTLHQSEDQRLRREMTIKVAKQREGDQLTLDVMWDLERMLFEETLLDSVPVEQPPTDF